MSARVNGTPRRRTSPTLRPHTLQTLNPTTSQIVKLAWSPNGHYLAAGVQQGPILLFAVLQAPSHPLRAAPLRTFKGHTADVLDLAFSPALILASASMDRSVRIWHPHSAHCLRRFAHADMVTAVAFHPFRDGVLLSAGCDAVARLWRLSDQTVLAHADVGAVATTAAFLRDGTACVGTYDGRVVTTPFRDDDASTAASSASTSLLPAAPTMDVLDGRKTRSRRKAGGTKVTALVGGNGTDAHAMFRDGRIVAFRGRGASVKMRVPAGRKEGVALGASMPDDSSFFLLDGREGVVRVADLRPGRAGGAAARRKDKEVAVQVLAIDVLSNAAVSCASFANNAVVSRCGLERQDGRSFVLAVGGDDGTLSIIEQKYDR